VQAEFARGAAKANGAAGWLSEAGLARGVDRVEGVTGHVRCGAAGERRSEALLVGRVAKLFRRERLLRLAQLPLPSYGVVIKGCALRMVAAGGGDVLARATHRVQRLGAGEGHSWLGSAADRLLLALVDGCRGPKGWC